MEEDLDRVIDLGAKKTELQWSYSMQKFFENYTTLWFTWLGWIITTSFVAYLARQTNDPILRALEAGSLLFLSGYLMFFCISIRIDGIGLDHQKEGRPYLKKIYFWTKFLVASIFTGGSILMIRYIVKVVSLKYS